MKFILAAVGNCDLATYRADRLLRQAIERNFEIIGEAAMRLSKEAPAIAGRVDHLPQIIAFRNLLIHGYDLIEPDRVWHTIQDHLPLLKDTVSALLQEEGQW